MAENLSAPMNDDNLIDNESLLFGFLAEYAQQNRFSVTINRLFKERGDNGMCIPMNIRADDIYFTVAGLREAKLNGVAVGSEYMEGVVEQLSSMSDEVKACGFCDTIIVKNKQLHGEVATGRAIASLLKVNGVKKLALFGAGKLAKSIMTHIHESGIEELVLMHDRVEACMELMQTYSKTLEGIAVDIDRVLENEAIELNGYDGFINATPAYAKLGKIDEGTLLIDLKNDTNLSEYAHIYKAHFVDDAEYAKVLAETNYTIWVKGE